MAALAALAPGEACHLLPLRVQKPERRLLPAEEEREKEATLAALPPGYYSPEFDPVAAELGCLRPAFTEGELEEVVEARAAALEVVSERLSAHVLARYDSFIAGVDEVRRGAGRDPLRYPCWKPGYSRSHLLRPV